VLQLVEQGLVELDAPISRYVPDWTQDAVTVRQLLNHTAGVFSYTRLYGPNADLSAETNPDALIDLFADAPLDFAPGAQFSYSDSGYILLGKLIETVSGQPYPTYLRQNVLDRAGLDATIYCVPAPAGIAQPYELRGNGLQPVELINFSHAYSAGGLCGTAADVVRWQKALHSGAIISPTSLQAMTTSGTLADGSPTGYGFGLFVENHNGHRLLGHNGVAPGFSAWSSYYPDDDLSVVLLANSVPGAFLLQDAAAAIAESLFTVP
jgi:CubicO group peptidase (beta-lactamase class C family)